MRHQNDLSKRAAHESAVQLQLDLRSPPLIPTNVPRGKVLLFPAAKVELCKDASAEKKALAKVLAYADTLAL
jgi:hypothetical protein